MLNSKEITAILAATLILGFVATLVKSVEILLYGILSVFIIIVLNIFAKKIASYYLDSEVEVKLWEMQKYGFKPGLHLKKPFPAGLLFPLIFAGLSLGYVKFMASLVFDVKAKTYRAAKRYGLYTFSEMTEYHIGLIAAAGIFMNLFLVFMGYFLGYEEFARLNAYYAFFNMIPFSTLDGNKIFFGSLILWSFLAALTLIALGYALLVI